jgi:hypothetical protein
LALPTNVRLSLKKGLSLASLSADKKTRSLIPTLQLISQEQKIGLMALTPGWPGHAPGPGKMAPLSRIVLRLRPKGPLGVGLRLLKKDELFKKNLIKVITTRQQADPTDSFEHIKCEFFS